MALRIRKDIKKSSYYVWFLGAKESKGIRGNDFILPVIEHLVQREKEIEPFKVTLQVSHKGLKIIQNVLSTNPKTSKPKNETIKHFIPHNTITCVFQDDDIVSCILLLYNPVTKCPLHVHVYRCDSKETASLLKGQLEVLIDRPENQKKFADLENRLTKPAEPKKKFDSSVGSDTGTSTRESESSEERYPNGGGGERMSSLYDSLAAELRQKLRKNSPILLPPRDYDTVHRQRGNLSGIETRRCLTASVVGPQQQQGLQRRLESSGGSSGIGSDHAPSPESEGGNYLLDSQSTSDEEWNTDQTDSTLYLMHGSDMILPRASRHPEVSKFSPEPPKSPTYHPDARFQKYAEDLGRYEKNSKERESAKTQESSTKRYEWYDNNGREKEAYLQRYLEEAPRYSKYEEANGPKRNTRYLEDFEEEYREKRPIKEDIRPRYDDRFYQEEERTLRSRYYQKEQEKVRPKQYYQDYTIDKSKRIPRNTKYPEEFFEDHHDSRRRPEDRQRSPTPPEHISPKDRFKDAKEKFLLLERERTEEERLRRQEMHHSVPNLKDKTFLKRHDSMIHPKDRFQDDRRFEQHYQPKPAPRTILEEERYRREPLDRYRSPECYEKNRRSLYNQIEDDHKAKSNEIAKELKRRSYMETTSYEKDYYRDDYPEKRYPNLDKESYHLSKSNVELDKLQQEPKYVKPQKTKQPAGYRHSYAEPKLSLEKIGKKMYPEMVHRTNSSVSNSGRVGLASVNPY